MIRLRIATWNVHKKPTYVEPSTDGKKPKNTAEASTDPRDDDAKAKCIARMVVRPDRDPMTWQDAANRGPGPNDPSIDLFALQEFPEDERFQKTLQEELDRLTTKGEYTITDTRVSTPQGDESKLKWWSTELQNDSLTLFEAGGQPDHYGLIYKSSRFTPSLSAECVAYLGKLVNIKIPINASPHEKTVQVSAVSSCRTPEPTPMEKFIFLEREKGRATHAVEPNNLTQWDKDKFKHERRSCLSVLTDRRPLYASMKAATGKPTFHVYNFHAPYKDPGIHPDWSMRAFAAYSFGDVAESQVQRQCKDHDVILFLGDFNLDEDGVKGSFFNRLSPDMKGGWKHVHNKLPSLSGYDHILVRPMSTNWEVSLKQVPYKERKSKKQEAKGLADQMESGQHGGVEEMAGGVYKFETGVGKEFLSDHLWVVADLELEETPLVGAKRKRGPAG